MTEPEGGGSRRKAIVIGVAVAAVALGAVLAFVLLRGDEEPEPAPTSTTTTVTTTTQPPTGPVAPLTGLRVPEDRASLLERPALAVKVDNHPNAVSQWGLADADVVLELQVEGISRFLAVYHSQDVGDVGPVRSARTSDPDLLAMFGRPLTAWSGANPATTSIMRSLDWIQDVSVDRLRGAYRRVDLRRAPHNLVLDARQAFAAADEPAVVPTPLFTYRDEDELPEGEPVPGVSIGVGLSRSEYVWDEERAGWLRWSGGEPLHAAPEGDRAGEQVAPANVVVLETSYGRSAADPRSPEAISLGEGRAWIYTAGRLVEGRWERHERTQPWTFTRPDGSPVLLTPGTTWVAMPAVGSAPELLTAEAAAGLRDA